MRKICFKLYRINDLVPRCGELAPLVGIKIMEKYEKK